MGGAALTVLGRWGAYPAPGGAGRGYLLEAGPDHPALLIGCGSGVAGRLGYTAAAVEGPGAVVLPDLRPDHCCDLWSTGSLVAAAAARGARRGLLPVYAFAEPAPEWRRLQRPGVLDVRRFSAGDTLRVAGWTITCRPSGHPWPGVSLRAETAEGVSFALIAPGPPGAELEGLLRGVGLVLAEVGGPPADPDEGLQGGMAPGAAGRLAATCAAGLLLLGHLDPGGDAEAALASARAAHPRSELALEGRTYSLTAP